MRKEEKERLDDGRIVDRPPMGVLTEAEAEADAEAEELLKRKKCKKEKVFFFRDYLLFPQSGEIRENQDCERS